MERAEVTTFFFFASATLHKVPQMFLNLIFSSSECLFVLAGPIFPVCDLRYMEEHKSMETNETNLWVLQELANEVAKPLLIIVEKL